MSQHDLNIANNTGLGFRNDLNLALAAIATNQSGTSAPIGFGLGGPYAYQTWIDTNGATEIYKIYNGASWVTLFDITGNNADYFAGNVTLRAQGELRLNDSDSSNYLAFRAPSTVASNVTWTLPAADGINRQTLITDGAGGFNFAHMGGALFYRLNSDIDRTTGTTSAQSLFNVGVSLAASTVYMFEIVAVLEAGTSATGIVSFGFAGTATVNNIMYQALVEESTGTFGTVGVPQNLTAINTASATAITNSTIQKYAVLRLTGTVSINAAGTLIPQFTTNTINIVYDTKAGSFMKLWPIGSAGSNSSAGTWS
jgi:hypothetical protein